MQENSQNNPDLYSDEVVDLATSPMDAITKSRIEWIETVLFCMENEDRLCDKSSHAAVEEFGFKGSKVQVEDQLRNLKDRLINTPYSETERENLIRSQVRYSKHITEAREFPPQKAYFEGVKQFMVCALSEQALQKLKVKVQEISDTIHDKGECICFNNK